MVLSAPVIILVSEQDEAGKNMRKALYELISLQPQEFTPPITWPEGDYKTEFTKDNKICMLSIPQKQIYAEWLEGTVETNLLIFASKHYSQTGRKTLLVHPVGNFTEVDMGSGQNKKVCIAPAYALYKGMHALLKYQSEANLDHYWVGMEVTHHGPSIDLPVIFMEAGGTIEEWQDLEATRVVAKAIVDVALEYTDMKFKEDLDTYIGFGGGHYAPSFIKRVKAEMLMLGHMIPKHKAAELNEKMLVQAYDKTIGVNKAFLLDKKGLKGSDRRRLIELIESLGYHYKLTTELPTNSG